MLDKCTLDNPNKISEFSKKFVVPEECIRGNLEPFEVARPEERETKERES